MGGRFTLMQLSSPAAILPVVMLRPALQPRQPSRVCLSPQQIFGRLVADIVVSQSERDRLGQMLLSGSAPMKACLSC